MQDTILSTNTWLIGNGHTNNMGGLESRPQSVCYCSNYRVNLFRYLRWAFI